jgi:hypothetical protein
VVWALCKSCDRRKKKTVFELALRTTVHACSSPQLISNYVLYSLLTCLLPFFLFPSGRRCCPYGPLLPVATILTLVATLLTWIASFDCSFYKANGLGIGLWTVEDPISNAFNNIFSADSSNDVCYWWNEVSFMKDLLDGPMKFARALSLVACLLSVPVSLIILLFSCMSMPKMFIKTLAALMFYLSVSVMLCLVSRACSIRSFTLVFNEPLSYDSDIYSRFVSGGPGFGYLH